MKHIKPEQNTINKQGIEIAHICALSQNHCIGKDNDLPWHISDDLKHFKRLTQGGVMVLGRKCYDSFGGRPLPKRSHWVVTRQTDWQSGFDNTETTTVQAAYSVDTALTAAIAEAKAKGLDTVWIIGGATIYEATLHLADRLELTHVLADVEGNTFYPAIPDGFTAEKQPVQHDDKSGLDFQFASYRKADMSS